MENGDRSETLILKKNPRIKVFVFASKFVFLLELQDPNVLVIL